VLLSVDDDDGIDADSGDQTICGTMVFHREQFTAQFTGMENSAQ
jgi:hypothetical protein